MLYVDLHIIKFKSTNDGLILQNITLISVEPGVGTEAEPYGVRILDVWSSHREPAGVPVHGCVTLPLSFTRPSLDSTARPLTPFDPFRLPWPWCKLPCCLSSSSNTSTIYQRPSPWTVRVPLTAWPNLYPHICGSSNDGFPQASDPRVLEMSPSASPNLFKVALITVAPTCLQGYIPDPHSMPETRLCFFLCAHRNVQEVHVHIRTASSSGLAP